MPEFQDGTLVRPTEVPQYVYSLGRIEPQFPQLGVEKELAQIIGRSNGAGLTDRAVLYGALSEADSRYLVRNLCWLLRIEGLETFIVIPRDPQDYEHLVESINPEDGGYDVDVIVGTLGPIAPPDLCAGVQLPVVYAEQIYSFDYASLASKLAQALAVDSGGDDDTGDTDDTPPEVDQVAREILERIMQIADNIGATDQHRALNYLVLRYQAVYSHALDMYKNNHSLSAIEVIPSRLKGARKVEDVVFSYTNRATDVTSEFFVRVDVTDLFPFIVSRLSPYFRR